MANRLTVMISSTARDLPEHRQAVREACLQQGCFPVMMEHMPASDADAVSASLALVDECDVYVGLYGWRYGHVPAGQSISITEMEHNRAVERGIPRLLFLMHDDHPVRVSDVEQGDGAAKLAVFKERMRTERVVNFFRSPEELHGQVVNSLAHAQARLEAGKDSGSVDEHKPDTTGGVTIGTINTNEVIIGDVTIDKRTVVQQPDDEKLDEVLAEVRDLRAVLLARFDVQEQRLTTVFVERLDAQQLDLVTAMVDAIVTEQTTPVENEALWAGIEMVLDEVAQQGERMAEMQALLAQTDVAEIAADPGLDVRHRLKITAPLVPLLLSYEGEVELNGRLNLEAVWTALVRKVYG